MTAIDKAAIAWTIAIVAVGVAFASVGGQFQSPTTHIQTAPMVVEKESAPTMKPIIEKAPIPMTEKPSTLPVEKPSTPSMEGPQTVKVSIPSGSSSPGCEQTKNCFVLSSVSIKKGDTVSWANTDSAAHTVTSGSPADGPNGMFDSSLLMGGKSFEHTFDSARSYDYYCMVHPWMTGNVQVS